MIRFMGAVLIMLGTAAWGILGVIKLRNRVKSLRALTGALGVMKSEICDHLTPIPALLTQLAAECTAPAALFFQNAADQIGQLGTTPFSALWRQAVLVTPELLLTPSEALVLTELGLCLGRYDIAEQRSAIQYAQRRLEAYVKQAEEERDRNSKVRAFLGVAAGLFAVVILL
ncbi:stage III sporulation protein AB [Oscillospiraceae bacterium CM]|nr:stage III sporulation protein AB [Oscillospiraceae bacterium CM]